MYKSNNDYVDTLIIGDNSVSFRGNWAWGIDRTTFLQQRRFRVGGKSVLIRKYNVSSAKSLTNMFVIDSLGTVLGTGIGHLNSDVGTVLYDKKQHRDIHNAIMNDSTFIKFE